eukprot:3976035-Amphidinium_carterae.1
MMSVLAMSMYHEASLLQPLDHGWDGGDTVGGELTGWTCRATSSQMTLDSDDDDDELDTTLSGNHIPWCLAAEHQPDEQATVTATSRKDKKALQRELPARVIAQLDQAFIDAFILAARKEEASWIHWGAVAPLSQTEVATLLGDRDSRNAVMTARAAFRDKASGTVPCDPRGVSLSVHDLQAKCRVVLRGFDDPHLEQLDRHSPVSLKSSLHILLQYFSSRMGDNWLLGTADVATAFLQGSASAARPQKLVMRPPRDCICVAAQVFPHEFYWVLSSIYGLADAPASFNKEARSKLRSIGAEPHPLDCMFMLWYGAHGLDCLLCAHVDDILWCRSPQWAGITELRGAFTYGRWQEYSLQHPGTVEYCGKAIAIIPSPESGIPHRVHLHQTVFAQETDVKNITMRGRSSSKLTATETTEYRSTTGCLQWLATSSRIDIAAGCSLLQSGQPEVTHLRGLYEHIQWCQDHPSAGIVFHSLPVAEWLLVGFSDASFSNACGERSQCGMLVCLTTRRALSSTTSSWCSPLEWRSHRSRRVARSTLSAETIAADATIDSLQFYSATIGSLLNHSPLKQVAHYLPWVCATDCRSLHDALANENSSTSERRVQIELASIRDALREVHEHFKEVPDRLLWVPSEWQLADPLTKLDKKLRAKCLEWMRAPVLRLRGHLLETTSSTSTSTSTSMPTKVKSS